MSNLDPSALDSEMPAGYMREKREGERFTSFSALTDSRNHKYGCRGWGLIVDSFVCEEQDFEFYLEFLI